MIPEPRNARITSVNLHSTLQWDPPRFPEGNITYTVQYKRTLRTGLRLPECELSSLSAYGDYVVQLRAEAGPLHSAWLSLRFKPMDNTTIGPPEVRLKSESGALHVDFWGPLAEGRHDRWPLKQFYGSWKYRILYWREGSTDTQLASASQVAQVDTQHSSEILSQLEPWTVYCVQVQAVIPELNKTGQLSRELCEQTTHNAVTVCFFCSFYLYRLTKHVFYPSYIFPQHLKEFLSKPPSASQPFPALPQEELLVYDRLTVISQESQSLSEGSGEEPSGTPEHPEDSAQGDPNSGEENRN
ncbi:hypothetical protein IHE44_0004894 [Lamprotornis superbus]|uniref:Interleukin-10 receptor subunit beta n=1 Tax=Lamprotornis superbus TaxID=245042 RepID=A0A835NDT5_9PASS|nr:hypothetical protein IHE44_0004894 [Lamprotornis superbus]